MDSKIDITDIKPSNSRLYKFTKNMERAVIIIFFILGTKYVLHWCLKTYGGNKALTEFLFSKYVSLASGILLLSSCLTYYIMLIICRAKGIELGNKSKSESKDSYPK
jgi:hypothetical protein